MKEWKQEAGKSPAVLDSKDSQRIVECVNDLEKIGHRAEMALQDITEIDTKMRDTLQHAQSELLILKKKLLWTLTLTSFPIISSLL